MLLRLITYLGRVHRVWEMALKLTMISMILEAAISRKFYQTWGLEGCFVIEK